MRIAIIGAGRMGRWFAKFFLEQGFTVVVSDKDREKLQTLKDELNVEVANNVKAVESADRILICVPINNFENVVRRISTHIQPWQEVMDICSVKEMPVNIMHKYIKNAVSLGTHPMFGPGAKSIKNQNFILTPTSTKERALARKIGRWLESKGAKVFFMHPHEHDIIMSIVIGLPYLLSYITYDTILSHGYLSRAKNVSGVSYKLLSTIMEALISEDAELIADIQTELQEINKLGELLLEKTKEWLKIVKKKQKTTFIKKATIIKNKIAETDPQYDRAYEIMYQMLEILQKYSKIRARP